MSYKQSDFAALAQETTRVVQAHGMKTTVPQPFRYSLSKLVADAGTSTIRKSGANAMISDILSLTDVCKVCGLWVLAEVEGHDVQFNPLVDFEEGVGLNSRNIQLGVDRWAASRDEKHEPVSYEDEDEEE